MKNVFVSLLAFFSLTILSAQEYTFSQSQETYTDLVDPISLTNGLTWDDPELRLPIGFEFQLFDVSMDSLFMESGEGELYNSLDWQMSRAYIALYDLDIADRAYDPDGDIGEPDGLSNVGYELSGTPGSRILKVEWKNVGFYDELEENGTSEDFANVQLWLYEGSNNLEFHYGPNSLTNLLAIYNYFGDEFEMTAGFDPFVSEMFGFSPEALGLDGDPTAPVFGQLGQLNAPVPAGTVYHFTKTTTTDIAELTDQPNEIFLFPNPVSTTFNWSTSIPTAQIESAQLKTVTGQVLRPLTFDAPNDVSDLSTGVYFLELQTTEGVLTRKIVKQ